MSVVFLFLAEIVTIRRALTGCTDKAAVNALVSVYTTFRLVSECQTLETGASLDTRTQRCHSKSAVSCYTLRLCRAGGQVGQPKTYRGYPREMPSTLVTVLMGWLFSHRGACEQIEKKKHKTTHFFIKTKTPLIEYKLRFY